MSVEDYSDFTSGEQNPGHPLLKWLYKGVSLMDVLEIHLKFN